VRYERPATLTPYQRKRCLVTGGSDKAARLALELAASGAKVVMVYGKERLSLLQPETERALWRAIRDKQLTLYLSAVLLEITPRDTRLQHQRGAAKAVAAGELRSTGAPGEERLEVEAIFALLGAPAPERLLRSLGVEYT
jgi:thioredoxin reductase